MVGSRVQLQEHLLCITTKLKIIFKLFTEASAKESSQLVQFVKGKGFLEVGTRSPAALATFRFDTRLIFMSWQPE